MSQTIDVNGLSINYPETGDPNWGDEATEFAVQTSAAFGKLGLASGTSVDIAQTLDVTGNTTLDANLSVAGTTSLIGNVTLTNNLTVNGDTVLGNASGDTTTVTGIVNVDSGVLYVDPVNNRVGINDTTPSEALDVTGNLNVTGDITFGGSFVAPLITASTSAGLGIDNNSGTDVALFGGSGGIDTVLYGGLTGTTGNFADTTDATSSTDGALKTAGGVGIAKKLFVGTSILTGNGSVSSPSISFSSDSDNGLYYIGTNNYGISVGGNKIGEFNSNGIQALNNYVLVVDEKTAGTQGGTFTSGAMRTRDLNTTKVNRITGYSLSSNQITLPAGTYKIHALVPSYDIAGNLAKLRNITDSTDVLFSNSGWTTSGGNNTNVVIIGEFTIASQKTFEIQHQCTLTGTTDGFGTANTIGVCIYTQVELWKLA